MISKIILNYLFENGEDLLKIPKSAITNISGCLECLDFLLKSWKVLRTKIIKYRNKKQIYYILLRDDLYLIKNNNLKINFPIFVYLIVHQYSQTDKHNYINSSDYLRYNIDIFLDMLSSVVNPKYCFKQRKCKLLDKFEIEMNKVTEIKEREKIEEPEDLEDFEGFNNKSIERINRINNQKRQPVQLPLKFKD